jgi:hypothetical protein
MVCIIRSKHFLEFVYMHVATGTLAGELSVEFLDMCEGHLVV